MNVDDAVIVALGSNQALGAAGPQEVLEAALARFPSLGLKVVKRSGWWRSKAWPDEAGPEFVNGVAWVETTLSPEEVMAMLHGLEAEFGRVRGEVNAPRTLDLDLIAYGRITAPLPRGERGRGEGVGNELSEKARAGAEPNAATPSNSPDTPLTQPFPPRGGRALILPHPRAHDRRFVMGPLAEIAPDWRHPVLGETAIDLSARAQVGDDAQPLASDAESPRP
jgi:2-amino-4-hydroxy-6-hydroxymethyldihydropteridine diphosphokinase